MKLIPGLGWWRNLRYPEKTTNLVVSALTNSLGQGYAELGFQNLAVYWNPYVLVLTIQPPRMRVETGQTLLDESPW